MVQRCEDTSAARLAADPMRWLHGGSWDAAAMVACNCAVGAGKREHSACPLACPSLAAVARRVGLMWGRRRGRRLVRSPGGIPQIITKLSPNRHQIITMSSPYHHQIITISSPNHHHITTKSPPNHHQHHHQHHQIITKSSPTHYQIITILSPNHH